MMVEQSRPENKSFGERLHQPSPKKSFLNSDRDSNEFNRQAKDCTFKPVTNISMKKPQMGRTEVKTTPTRNVNDGSHQISYQQKYKVGSPKYPDESYTKMTL